jgi:hypothetical protein
LTGVLGQENWPRNATSTARRLGNMDGKSADPKLPIGSGYCRCPKCGEYFLSEAAFSAHRRGDENDRHCLAAEDMNDRGMVLVARQNGYYRVTKAMEGRARGHGASG